ncbi:cell wall anchor protein [Nocardiopsis coralliicola]
MTAAQLWALVGLGLFHGANPGMGWLPATARGLQEGGRAALLKALPALALGHAAAIACVAVAVTATGSLAASHWFGVAGGALLVAAGLWLLLRRAHFHLADVRMSLPQLGVWSFFMASLHGAGLMVLPVLAGDFGPAGAGVQHGAGHGHGTPADGAGAGQGSAAGAPHAGPPHLPEAGWTLADATLAGLAATAVHTAAMVAATGVLALLAYDFVGVHALRLRQVTMDRVWAFALIAGGLFAALAGQEH